MKHSALEFLQCLRCRSGFDLKEQQESAGEIISGELACKGCAQVYPIRAGVPRFVDSALSSAVNLETGQRFGQAWKEFPRLDQVYQTQFFDWIFPVDADFVRGKVVLEGGCGKGRHAQIMSASGARHVFAVDIGDAVDVAYKNAGHLPNVHIIQSDILNLPFGRVFDFAFSVGVLHHMDSPASGFASIAERLKDNAAVAVWVYGLENNWWLVHIVNPIRTMLTSRMDSAKLKLLSLFVALPLFVLCKFLALPYSKLRERCKWLPGLFYLEYLSYIGKFDLEEIHHIVFDHLVAPVSNYIPGKHVRSWFLDHGFSDPIVRWHNRNSWAGFASRTPQENAGARGKCVGRYMLEEERIAMLRALPELPGA